MATCDIGIDLGTTNVRVYINGKGMVIDEPAVIAVDAATNDLIAVGREAAQMIGKNPDKIIVKYPLVAGVISDYERNEMMIKEFLRRASNNMLIKPRVCVCIHTLITDVERRAVVEAAVAAGARKVYLIEEPIAAALGADMDLLAPKGVMVADIGGGTTDVAVLSMNGTVVSKSIKVGGQNLDDAIKRQVYLDHQLFIGLPTAEQAKIVLGTASKPSIEKTYTVGGRNLMNGLPRTVVLSQAELYEAIAESIHQIIQTVRDVLEHTPPELVGDIHTDGILLTGGTALLSGMSDLLASVIGVPVILPEDPVGCVAVGTGKVFDMLDSFNSGFVDADTYGH